VSDHGHRALSGVNPILPTPFADDGALDLASLRRLVEFQVEAGVHGLAILGFMGEAHKLDEAERRSVIETSVASAGPDVPVWVGVRSLGTAGAIEQARQAADLGAAAVFVAPAGPQSDAALYEYFGAVAAAVDVPLILHDFPESFGITLSPDLIARLARDGIAPYIKAEEPPVLQKMSQVLDLAEGRIGVFGGLGGTYFLEELERGAIGIMTGLAYPEVLVAIFDRFVGGDHAGAAEVFDRYIPYIRYEFQPKIGLAYRKHVFWKRGIIASTAIRSPGLRLDDRSRDELERIVRRVGLPLEPGLARI
jgi:4-hydroxy-tetrahydrodipicolinate synthase